MDTLLAKDKILCADPHAFNGFFTLPGMDLVTNLDLDSKPDGYMATWTQTQIPIQIQIPDHYCNHFWDRISVPGLQGVVFVPNLCICVK